MLLSESFADPQLCRTRSRIALIFLLRGADRLAGDDLDLRFFTAYAHGEVLRTGTALRLVAHKLLDDAILQRMEGDHAESSALVEQLKGAL